MNTIREIEKINEEELKRGIAGTSASWHAQYEKAPWVYVGNLDHELTEGDIICVMSQFGEIEDIHLVREEDTGKSKGFGFVKYEDSRSCILAVDNFAGVKLAGRPMRVDHVEKYRLPKHLQEKEDEAEGKASSQPHGPGQAYKARELANDYNLEKGHDLFAPLPPPTANQESSSSVRNEKDEKFKRKEERNRLRQEKEQRKLQREKKRLDKEEGKRKRRAHRIRRGEDDSKSDDDDDNDDRSREGKHRKTRKHEEKKKRQRRSPSRSLSPSSDRPR